VSSSDQSRSLIPAQAGLQLFWKLGPSFARTSGSRTPSPASLHGNAHLKDDWRLTTPMALLEIKDLHVEVDGKEIPKGLNLTVDAGQVHAKMAQAQLIAREIIT